MSFDPSGPASAESGIYGLDSSAEEAAVILVPVPVDATTSYGDGTRNGPAAIHKASMQVDLYDIDTGRPYEAGIHMLPESSDVRGWNAEARRLAERSRERGDDAEAVERVNAIGAQINAYVHGQTKTWLERGRVVGVVGGDHSVPFGTIAAHVEKYPDIGVLHVDAHADLRNAYEGFTWSHASIMHNVISLTPLKKLVQVGIRDFCEPELHMIQASNGRIVTIFDRDIAARAIIGRPFQETIDQILGELPHHVYVSFDIDGLEPVLCPHTGTPVPGGLTFNQAAALLAAITRSGRRIVGFDLNEVAPGPDGDDWDGNVGARLVYKLCGHSLIGR